MNKKKDPVKEREAMVEGGAKDPPLRTQEQMVEFMNASRNIDPFGWTIEALIDFLDFEHAKTFLREDVPPEVAREEWRNKLVTRRQVFNTLRIYMEEYGIPKALGHRGLSANRSVLKMRAWLYALGEDDLVRLCEDQSKYPQYGVPILAAICGRFSLDQPLHDPHWVNMMNGRPCEPGCSRGCGL